MVWIYENLSLAHWELGQYEEGLEFAERLVGAYPTYMTGYAYIAMNAVELGNLDQARAAIAEGRLVQSDLSIALIQSYMGNMRPAIDKQRDDALRIAGLK